MTCFIVACSHTSQVLSAESHQTGAMLEVHKAAVKVESDRTAQFAEVANLATKEKILLSLPDTSETHAAQETLVDTTLSLSGAPSENETRLEGEVASLLAGGEKQEAEIVRLNGVVTGLKNQDAKDMAAKQKAETKLTATTTSLYQVATVGAESADYSISIFKYVLIGLAGIAALVILWTVLRIVEHFSEATATTAAKLP